jgi:hypothetical protein
VFGKVIVIAIRKIGAVVTAAAFLASQGGLGHEQREGVKISQFMFGAIRAFNLTRAACGLRGACVTFETFTR